MLAATARWRQQELYPAPAPFSIWSDASSPRVSNRRFPRFRPPPRIVRSLDTNSQARGQAVIRFGESRGDEWVRSSNRRPVLCGVTTVNPTTMSLEERERARCFMIERSSVAPLGCVGGGGHCVGEDGENNDAENLDASWTPRDGGGSRTPASSSKNPVPDTSPRPDPHSLKDPLLPDASCYAESFLPDPVVMTRAFVDGLSKKLSKVDPTMILCADDILYIHELILTWDLRRLQYLTRRLHDFHVLLTWPAGWVFTVIDWTRSARLQKVTAAVTRDGHICCSGGLLSIGVVHDVSREAGEAEFPVVVVDRDGFVYLYDDGGIAPVVHLLTKCGFADFCRRGLRERCGGGMDVGSTPVDYGSEPLSSLLAARSSIDELAKARDRLLGSEVAIFHCDDMWTVLRVSDLRGLDGFDENDLENWKQDSGHLRLETIFAVKACVSGTWIVSPVLVSDAGTIFYVDPNDRRIRFLAADLYSFVVLGVMRFRNNSCFPRGTFSAAPSGAYDVRSLPRPGLGTLVRPALSSRPIFCPRGRRCKRNKLTLTGRVWRCLLGTWGFMTGCCRG